MHLLHRSSGEGEVFGGYAARDADEPGVGAPDTAGWGARFGDGRGLRGEPARREKLARVARREPAAAAAADVLGRTPRLGLSKKARRRWYDRDWDSVFPLLPERLTRQPRFVRGRAAAVARTRVSCTSPNARAASSAR